MTVRRASGILGLSVSILLAGGVALAQMSDGIHRVKGEFSTRSHRCLTLTSSGGSPEWNDSRLSSVAGRTEIIQEAFARAIKYLARCRPDSVLGRVIRFNSSSPRLKGLYEKDLDASHRIYVGIDIKYVQTQNKGDTAARTSSSGTYTHTPEQQARFSLGSDPMEDLDGDGYYSVDEFWDDKFRATVEVFPAVFERREFMIPDEGWAEDPVDALTHVLLHEFAHYEAHISYDAHYSGFSKVEAYENDAASEVTADQWASSVVRCATRP